jgi:hypothetical protein
MRRLFGVDRRVIGADLSSGNVLKLLQQLSSTEFVSGLRRSFGQAQRRPVGVYPGI